MQRTWSDRWKRIVIELIPLLVVVACVVIDQLTKKWTTELFEKNGRTTVIDGFFYLTHTINTGAAFGSLGDKPWAQTFFKILTCISLVLFCLFYVYAFKHKYNWLKYSLAIVIAGTLGNFIDRIAISGVIDFISLVFGSYSFYIFNLADAFLTVGVIMLIIHLLFIDEGALFKKKNGKEEVSDNQ